jgi:tetratricopeptide (TPR) repeat protein
MPALTYAAKGWQQAKTEKLPYVMTHLPLYFCRATLQACSFLRIEEDMARKKKKKKSTEKAATAPPMPEAQKADMGAMPEQKAPAEARGQVTKSTFFVSLLLALLLGLYLGSLAPMFFMQERGPQQHRAAVEQPMQQAPDTQKTPSPAAEQHAARIAALEEALRATPADARKWADLGNLYFDSQQPEKAVAAYEKSLEFLPNNADVRTDMGIMLREMGKFEKAVAQFRKASSINPRHENAIFNEGVVLYYDLQRTNEARAAWQRLLAVNPAARTPDGRAVADMLKELP